MTPDGQMKNIGNFGAKNIKVMPDGKTYIVGTDGSMKYVGTHVKPPTATQSGTSGYNAQVLRTLSAQHTAWSDDQIAAEHDAAGYGNYKSWLKSY